MSNKLAALRKKHGFSRPQLAERVEVAAVTLGRWERGEAVPRKYNLLALCEILKCTEEDLGFSTQPLTVVVPLSSIVPLYDAIIPLTPIDALIGRETELAHIKARLLGHTGSSEVLSALNGIPGVGKTSLAIAIAHDPEIRASFSGGILWAALGPTPNIPKILNRWAKLLDLPNARFRKLDQDQKRQAVQNALKERSMLLVLDDVWRWDDVHALRLNCASLLTTRFPGIASRAADALLIGELNPEQSFHLLSTLAPDAVKYEPEKVRALVQIVGGLPLALTLFGKYLRLESYGVSPRRALHALESLNDAQMRFQISEEHVQAEAHPSIDSSMPISLQSIIAVSDHALTVSARRTLYALSVFPSKPESFSEEAALTIAACTTRELDELIDAGLLESSGDRYRLHCTISDYARLRIGDETEQRLTRLLIAYVQHYVESHANEYELLEQEITLLLYALDKVVTDQACEVWLVPFVCLLAPFLLMRGYYQEAERFLDHAYEQARASQDAADITRVLLHLGELDEKRGDIARAKERYNRVAQEIEPHAPLQGILLCHMGRLAWKLGDHQGAEALLQEGLAFVRQIGEREWTCAALLTLTIVLCEMGQCERAKTYLQEASALAKELEIPRFVCSVWEAEGKLALALHRGDDALHAFQKMHRLRPYGDIEIEALACYGMACSYEQIGQADRALSFGQQALALVQQKKLVWHEERIQAWYAQLLEPSTSTESLICIYCGKPIDRSFGPGRTGQYCSVLCVKRARKRKGRTNPNL